MVELQDIYILVFDDLKFLQPQLIPSEE